VINEPDSELTQVGSVTDPPCLGLETRHRLRYVKNIINCENLLMRFEEELTYAAEVNTAIFPILNTLIDGAITLPVVGCSWREATILYLALVVTDVLISLVELVHVTEALVADFSARIRRTAQFLSACTFIVQIAKLVRVNAIIVVGTVERRLA